MINPVQFIYFVVALLLALTVHEAAHALVANRLGDPTAKKLGRLSLNPLVHLDPMGTIMIVMSSLSGFGFGWGKPVPVNPRKLHYGPKTGMALVAFAGPFSNLALAAFSSSILHSELPSLAWQFQILSVLVIVNVVLAVFNMLPIPPLDGFRVLLGILPNRPAYALARVEQYGPAILLLFVFFGGGLLRGFLTFFSNPIFRMLGM